MRSFFEGEGVGKVFSKVSCRIVNGTSLSLSVTKDIESKITLFFLGGGGFQQCEGVVILHLSWSTSVASNMVTQLGKAFVLFLVNLKLLKFHCIYKFRRKRIGTLATKRWGNNLPRFNTPETKQQLAEFAKEITPECGIPEINFGEDGIAKHIQTFYTEQRRYQKNRRTQTPCEVCYMHFIFTDGDKLMCKCYLYINRN